MNVFPFSNSALAGKVALITGAGSGIGRATAIAFAKAGAKVVLVGRRMDKLRDTADDVAVVRGTALPFTADVSDQRAVENVIKRTVAELSALDILVNSAGISPDGTVTETSAEDFESTINVDLKSVFLLCKAALPVMQMSGGGVILNIAGTFGVRPGRGKAAYATAKAGVINLSRSIALDYARDQVRCNAICPGFVDTPLTAHFDGSPRAAFLDQYQPMSGVLQPQEVAALAVFLATDAARMITGQAYLIDGGQQAGLYT